MAHLTDASAPRARSPAKHAGPRSTNVGVGSERVPVATMDNVAAKMTKKGKTATPKAKLASTVDLALLAAARRGDPRAIRRALADGAKTGAADATGNALMGLRPARSRRRAVQLLIDEGVDPNHVTIEGHTPLIEAVLRDDRSLVQTLLDSGSRPNLVNRQHETALSFAAVWGRLAIAGMLLRGGARVDHPARPWTPLMYAAHEGNVRLARLFLRTGANLHRKDQYGRTAEDIASDARHEAMVRALRNYGKTWG